MAISLWCQEYEPENMCPTPLRTCPHRIHHRRQAQDEQKNKVGQLFDQVCGDVFGEQKGDTFVIFKEHPNSNVCARGVLKTMDPKPPINPYRSQQ